MAINNNLWTSCWYVDYRMKVLMFLTYNLNGSESVIIFLCAGLGLGFINPSSFIAVNSYFSTKRSRAVGFALAGTGVGQMLMPFIVRHLLDEYGFKGTALIMGALSLNGVVGAALFQPVEWHMKRFGGGSCSNEKRILLQPCRHSLNQHKYQVVTDADTDELSSLDDTYDTKSTFNDTISIDSEAILIRTKPNWKHRIYKALDLQLLSDPIFISICIGLALAYTASINFSMIFPYFLQVSSFHPFNHLIHLNQRII